MKTSKVFHRGILEKLKAGGFTGEVRIVWVNGEIIEAGVKEFSKKL